VKHENIVALLECKVEKHLYVTLIMSCSHNITVQYHCMWLTLINRGWMSDLRIHFLT